VRQQSDSTAVADSLPLQKLERVSIDVDHHHPLLRLKRALDWEAIQRVMVAAWRKANKTSMEDLGCRGPSHCMCRYWY
jgi:hypothetical protein